MGEKWWSGAGGLALIELYSTIATFPAPGPSGQDVTAPYESWAMAAKQRKIEGQF
jgi:hypothetical protein